MAHHPGCMQQLVPAESTIAEAACAILNSLLHEGRVRMAICLGSMAESCQLSYVPIDCRESTVGWWGSTS